MPVEAVAAEAKLEFRDLWKLPLVTDLVVRPEMDLKHTEHHALIRDGAEAVELRGHADLRIRLIEPVSIHPKHRL